MSDGVNFTDFPPWEAMDFTRDCKAWGNWYSSFISPSQWDNTEYLDGDSRAVITYFLSSLPNPQRHNLSSQPSLIDAKYLGSILDWYGSNYYEWLREDSNNMSQNAQNFQQLLLVDPRLTCPKELCKAVGWTGDMDLIGIGVFVSYFVEAVLVTFFLIAYSRRQLRSSRHPSRTLEAFRRSLKSFLNATQVFSIAMLVAAVYISGVGIVQRETAKTSDRSTEIPHGSALYDMMLSMLASTFSMFPVIILYAMHRRDTPDISKAKKRELWFGRFIMSLIWALGVIEAFLSLYGNFDYDFHMSKGYFPQPCDWRDSFGYWYGMKAAQVLLFVGPFTWLTVTIFLLTGFGRPGIVDKPLLESCRSHWRLAVAWINLLAMWGILGFFTWVRHKIDGTVEDLNESNNWNFGQWLAVATWIPVVLRFSHKLIEGVKGGSNREVSEQVTEQEVPDNIRRHNDSLELQPMPHAESSASLITGKSGKVMHLSEDMSYQQESVYSFLQRTETDIYRKTAMDQWQETGWPSGEDD